MAENKNGKTDFLDTLIEAYNSMDQSGKERLNEIAMSIYITMRGNKEKNKESDKNQKSPEADIKKETAANEVKENTKANAQNNDKKKVLSGFFNSLKSLSKADE